MKTFVVKVFSMNEIIKKVKENKSADFLNALLIGFLIGTAVGFIFSPVKNGIAIGSYNGCNNKIYDKNKDKKHKE